MDQTKNYYDVLHWFGYVRSCSFMTAERISLSNYGVLFVLNTSNIAVTKFVDEELPQSHKISVNSPGLLLV